MKSTIEKKDRFIGVKVEPSLYARLYEKTTREISISDLMREAALLLLSQIETSQQEKVAS